MGVARPLSRSIGAAAEGGARQRASVTSKIVVTETP